MGVFNKDHYPTPEKIIDRMCEGIVLHDKNILEPSVGSGAIVDYLNFLGANVIGCEIDDKLRIIAQEKCRIIEHDFLNVKSDQVSHINYIIMNPPFSADEKHIIHAWNIAPDGCVIRALCNFETIRNAYTQKRGELREIIHNYGSADSWGSVFMDEDTERRTPVEIGFIELKKPRPEGWSEEDEFQDFFMSEDEEYDIDGLQKYNFVRDVVNRYVGAIKIFDEQMETAIRLNNLTESFFSSSVGVALVMGEGKAKISRDEYKKELQKSAWSWVFRKFNMEKYVTKSVKEDINKFVEQNKGYPFTMKNVYRMIEILLGTINQRMDKALLEVFESLTKSSHENRWNYEGFKTNSNYLVNEKFIMTSLFNGGGYLGNGSIGVSHDGWRTNEFQDFVKALCYIEGINYDKMPTLYDFLQNDLYATYPDGSFVMIEKVFDWGTRYDLLGIRVGRYDRNRHQQEEKFRNECKEKGYLVHEKAEWGKWFDFGFFEIKGYKKGTGHFKFKDREVWARFNQQIARIKGFPLPESHDEGSKKRNEKARKKKNEEYSGKY